MRVAGLEFPAPRSVDTNMDARGLAGGECFRLILFSHDPNEARFLVGEPAREFRLGSAPPRERRLIQGRRVRGRHDAQLDFTCLRARDP